MDSTSFVYWSPARRLLSATCPNCARRVTISSQTWRRWSNTAQRVRELTADL
jgi:hypothetical protein